MLDSIVIFVYNNAIINNFIVHNLYISKIGWTSLQTTVIVVYKFPYHKEMKRTVQVVFLIPAVKERYGLKMTGKKQFVLKGDICYSKDKDTLETLEQGWLVCEDGVSAGVYQELPEEFKDYELIDCKKALIVPGLTDLHIHAPQYSYRGLGMDLELLEWLDTHTFPAEAKYEDIEYAKRAYSIFTRDLKNGATTRACIFATIHAPATELLMDMLEKTGIKAMVGKVNMDRNSPDNLREADAARAQEDTTHWIKRVIGNYKNIKPILTPRFIPTCSDDLMERLKRIQEEFQLPVQSHLSENQGEMAWVKELCPWSEFYGGVYDHFGLFGGTVPTIMAHCVHSTVQEIDLIRERGVYVAHCPQSNTNLASGIAPIRRYLEAGIRVGLGSDVAGGFTGSIFRAMADAIQVSKLRWRFMEDGKPLTAAEAFYLGTLGGGSFFGKAGSFEEGYEFDAVVVDDKRLESPDFLSVEERLERVIYLAEDQDVTMKFAAGIQVK